MLFKLGANALGEVALGILGVLHVFIATHISLALFTVFTFGDI